MRVTRKDTESDAVERPEPDVVDEQFDEPEWSDEEIEAAIKLLRERQGIPETVTIELPPEPEPAPELGPLDLSKTTPEFWASFVAAQAAVQTVGKDEKHDQRGYKYATAENMIRGTRNPLTSNGLAFLSAYERIDPVGPGGPIGNQFVCATIRVHFAIVHTSGAMLRGTADMDAIGSPARPPDKAIAAATTYVRGFILRDLLNMDREEEDKDAPDKRDDDKAAAEDQRKAADARKAKAKADAEARKAKAQAKGGKMPQPSGEGGKLDALRANVRSLLREYHERAHVSPRDAMERAGVTSQNPSAEELRTIKAWAEEQLDALDPASGDDEDAGEGDANGASSENSQGDPPTPEQIDAALLAEGDGNGEQTTIAGVASDDLPPWAQTALEQANANSGNGKDEEGSNNGA